MLRGAASHAAGRVAPLKTSSPNASIDPSIRRARIRASPRNASAITAIDRICGRGPRIVLAIRAVRGPRRLISSAHALPAPRLELSNDSTVAPTSRQSAIAVPSMNGWAITTDGRTQARPSCSNSSSLIAGETIVIGLKPAQWSCQSWQGRLAAIDAPPGRGACSSTVTSSPARARLIAQTKPQEPAPMTSTRRSVILRMG